MFNKKSYAIKRRWPLIGIISLLLLLIISAILFVPSIKGTGKPYSRHPSSRSGQAATPDIAATTLTPTLSVTPTPLFFDDFIENSQDWALSGPNDFSLSVTFTLLKGDENDCVGLYLRGDSNLDHDYRIDIFGNNRFAINKELL